jgi:hypothetical protein
MFWLLMLLRAEEGRPKKRAMSVAYDGRHRLAGGGERRQRGNDERVQFRGMSEADDNAALTS